MKGFRQFIVVFLLVSLASFIIYQDYKPYLGIDDAYIYFVYAKNIANGHGFVYNIGGEKVEGFTSMLWVLICSFFYKFFTNFRFALVIFNIMVVSFALSGLVNFIDEYFVKRKFRLISFSSFFLLAILFSIKGFIDWVILSLLETGLWSSVLIILIVHLLRLCYKEPGKKETVWFSIMLFFLALTRPEGLLWGIVFIVLRSLIFAVKKYLSVNICKTSLLPAIIFAATLGGLIIFRLKYFGYPFPNTYYAKVSTDRWYNFKEGLVYFLKFIFVYPVYVIPILAILFSLYVIIKNIFKNRKGIIGSLENFSLAQFMICIIVLIALCVPVLIGGDHFSLFRVYQPFAPACWLLLFNTEFIREKLFDLHLKNFPATNKTRWLSCLLLLPFFYLINLPKYFINPEKAPYKASLLNDFSFPESYKAASAQLNNFFDFVPRPSIGRIWAGAYAFAYDGPTIDLMGLNNTLMAHASKVKVGLKNHAAFNKTAFYKLKPDFVDGEFIPIHEHFELPENKPGFDGKNFESNVMKGIFRDTAFINLYQPVLISHSPDTAIFFTYARKDYISLLQQKGFTIQSLGRKRIE